MAMPCVRAAARAGVESNLIESEIDSRHRDARPRGHVDTNTRLLRFRNVFGSLTHYHTLSLSARRRAPSLQFTSVITLWYRQRRLFVIQVHFMQHACVRARERERKRALPSSSEVLDHP